MSLSLAKKYATLLSTEDTILLTRKLIESYRNVTTVARLIGLGRKTLYNWGVTQQLAGMDGPKIIDVKDKNKAKILEQSLEMAPLETFEFLAGRVATSSAEVVMSYFVALYENILRIHEPLAFERLANRFMSKVSEYIGLVGISHSNEINSMLSSLIIYAQSIGSTWRSPRIYTYNSLQLADIVVELIRAITSPGTVDLDELSIRLRIPQEVIYKATDVLDIQGYIPRNRPEPPESTTTAFNSKRQFYNSELSSTESNNDWIIVDPKEYRDTRKTRASPALPPMPQQ
jgi:hypothetical protein